MKKINILFLAFIVVGILSCGKEEDDIVDCFSQSLLLNIHHSTATDNAKQINFNVTYAGNESLESNIQWDFGDGTSVQTVSGVTASHVYVNAGSYQVKAVVKIKGSCSNDLKESVTVE
jgi:hypothetical protein